MADPGIPRPSWREAASAIGVGVLCAHTPEGDWYTFLLTDAAKAEALGFTHIGTLLTLEELRAQLAQAGFSSEQIDRSIEVAHRWATTTNRTITRGR